MDANLLTVPSLFGETVIAGYEDVRAALSVTNIAKLVVSTVDKLKDSFDIVASKLLGKTPISQFGIGLHETDYSGSGHSHSDYEGTSYFFFPFNDNSCGLDTSQAQI